MRDTIGMNKLSTKTNNFKFVLIFTLHNVLIFNCDFVFISILMKLIMNSKLENYQLSSHSMELIRLEHNTFNDANKLIVFVS